MRFFKKLFDLAKKAVSFIANLFKDRNPVEVVNDISKAVVGVATAALAIYTGINIIRVNLMSSKKKTNNENKSDMTGPDYIFKNREAGSIDEKLSSLKKKTSKIGKKRATNMKKEELDMLARIAKTRNKFFQSLSPEEQMNVLKIEDFNFKEFSENEKMKGKKGIFKWNKTKSYELSITPENAFRKKTDYGFFNFIMQPLDNFYHWIINDPVPKKVAQIKLIDRTEFPDIDVESSADFIDAARNLDFIFGTADNSEFDVYDPVAAAQKRICAEEIFRHKSLKKFKKAVKRRMAKENGTINVLDLLNEIDDVGKKKKKKKHKDKKDHDHESKYSSVSDSDKKKKKKKKDKKEEEAVSRAAIKAKKLYEYHLKMAMKGEYPTKGFDFDF